MRSQFRMYVLATLVTLLQRQPLRTTRPSSVHSHRRCYPRAGSRLRRCSRERPGPEGDRRRQTTTVFSAGMQPFKRPLAVAVVVPVSFIGSTSTAGGRTGIEDVLLSARYRLESERFTNALGLDESYLMGVGGV